MNTKEQTSTEIADNALKIIHQQPSINLFIVTRQIIAELVEVVRAESVPTGIMYRGKENLKFGAVRLHCRDGVFIVPSFQTDAIKAVDKLLLVHDFSLLEVKVAGDLIHNKAKQLQAN